MRLSPSSLSLFIAIVSAVSNTSTVTNTSAVTDTAATGPFLQTLNSSSWVIGNDHWNITIGSIYGKKLFYKGRDLIGNAVGHYSGYDGESNFVWTSAEIYEQTSEHLDVVFSSTEIDLHWVIQPELAGAYQYIVNKALPSLSVLRTLYRLDNTTFTHGRTNIKDEALPPLSAILSGTKVQDETWQLADGSYITKYDFSDFLRYLDFHGVYGEGFGSWYIRPGRDYFNGNQLKQELTVHRESSTGDAVELNVVHDSHFQVTSLASFPVGKTWGPWLWYLNDGSQEDATARVEEESSSWPYSWYKDPSYQSRGSVSGKLVLSDGRAAAGAAVFLGDTDSNKSTLDQGADYYYTATADASGHFNISAVRSGVYGIYAWSDGGLIADVSTTFTQNNITLSSDETADLGTLYWSVPSRETIFQIGDVDHKALGFKNSGAYHHGLAAKSPANLTYTVGNSSERDWYYAQSSLGTWTVVFDVDTPSNNHSAVLGVSLAGYSQSADLDISVNGQLVGQLLKENLASDPALYRSGTVAGEWRYFEFPVDGTLLRQGRNNVVQFTVTRFTLWRGFMWDSVFLAWEL